MLRLIRISLLAAMSLVLAFLLGGCGSSNKEGGNNGNVALTDEATCRVCHAATIDPVSGTAIVPDYLGTPDFVGSVHFQPAPLGCQGCHGGGSQHNGIGPIPYPNPLTADRCITCHTPGGIATTTHDLTGLFAVAKNGFVSQNCAHCHTDTGNSSVHAAQIPAALTGDRGNDCIRCHDVAAPQHGTDLVNDNNGVRAIVGEFNKRSHHVSGRAVKNSDCVACHMEGKVVAGSVVVDSTYHMASNKIHLRNGNTGLGQTPDLSTASVEYQWDPANPDHTLMDQFCFSCHNEAGAPDSAAALAGATGYTGTALNPFGDTISNANDQVLRPAVVGVYEQFDKDNSSHHAVRAQKYNATTLDPATFTTISTANMNFKKLQTPSPIPGAKAFVGTMFSANKFTATYTTLNNVPLADNVTIHCGDCHSVGQWKPGANHDAAGNPTTVVIGAHGSENEYLLRNSNGDDTFNKDALVCYICHSNTVYGIPSGDHHGVASSTDHCDADDYNTAGLAGRARLVPAEGGIDDLAFQDQVQNGHYGGNGGGNIFGIKCANCHNASDKKTFGGIHGNAHNATYTSYSGGKLTAADVTVPVQRLPYRFMPGLGNFRYNGGDNPTDWTVRSVSSVNKQSCYTLNGASALQAVNPNPSRTFAANANPGNVSALATTGDNGILGSWGACTDHAGTSVFGGGHDPNRTLLRPLTY